MVSTGDFASFGDQTQEDSQLTRRSNSNRTCTIVPSTTFDITEEKPYVFLYYYNGKLFTGCQMFDQGGFIHRIYMCPTRNMTTNIIGIDSFNSGKNGEFIHVYCDCSFLQSRVVFKQYKNYCHGGESKIKEHVFYNGAYGIIGGGAVPGLGAATAGIGALSPAAAGRLGLAGTVG